MKLKFENNISNYLNYVLVLSLVYILITYFYGHNWGSPSKNKISQIFPNVNDLRPKISLMIELREKFYSSVRNTYDPKKEIKKSLEDTYFHNIKSEQFQELTEELKLDFIRGYFLGSVNSDEQRNIVAVSNLDPLKLDFNPNDFVYGGLYFYIISGSFLMSKIIGLIEIKKDISFYFNNSWIVSNLYLTMRFVSLFSSLLLIIFLYSFVKKTFCKLLAIFSEIVLLIFPIVFVNSKLAKPHTLGALFVFLGFYFLCKIFKNDELKNYIYSAIFFGLSFSVLYPNVFSIILLYIAEYYKNNFNLRKVFNKKLVLCTGIFFITFFIFNWYLLTNLNQFFRQKEGLEILFNYGTINFFSSINFLKEFFSISFPYLFLPIFFVGAYVGFRNKDKIIMIAVTFVCVHFLFIVFYLKHPNVFIISLPLVSLVCVNGVDKIFKNRNIFGIMYIFVVILFFTINLFFGKKMFVKEGNLTKCGQWINQNIPANSKIGVENGYFSFGTFPAIKFLDYRLIHFPIRENYKPDELKKFPQYLVAVNINSNKMKCITKYYKIVYELKNPLAKNWLFNVYKNIPSENQDCKVFKKI